MHNVPTEKERYLPIPSGDQFKLSLPGSLSCAVSFPRTIYLIMAPKGSFPVGKPDGSFPTAYNVFDMNEEPIQTMRAPKTHLSLAKSMKMMNSCFKDTQRAVYPMHSGYKSLYTSKDQDNDALPLLEHAESRCEETLDFIGVATA